MVTTAPGRTATGTAGIRLVPRPISEPPFDDELPLSARPDLSGAPAEHVQGALALAFRIGRGVPAIPEPPAQLRLLPEPPPDGADGGAEGTRHTAIARAVDAFCARQATPRADLPDPRRWCARLTQALVEVLAGVRPLTQLSPWVTEGVYADLTPRVRALSRRRGREHGASAAPARAHLRTIRVCEPADGVAEASAVVQYGERCRAVALRLEGLDGKWRCTELQFI